MIHTSDTRSSVAVIIPFFNGSPWIERALTSVYAQSVPATEVIVVNDGSRPEELRTLEALTSKYDFTIINKKNGGQGSARNAGVSASESNFICFLDQDDFFLPTHIEDLLTAIPERGRDHFGWVYSDLCEGDEHGNIVNSHLLRDQRGAHPKSGHIEKLLGSDLFILPSASLISRHAFEAVGGFDEQFRGFEDDDLFLRMFRAGFSNHFQPIPLSVWCMHGGSTGCSPWMSRSRLLYFKKLATAFPDDRFRRRYYLRNTLVPRFGGAIISDAINAKGSDAADRIADLLEYSDIIFHSRSIPRIYKAKLALVVCLFTRMPAWMTNIARAAYNIPISRHILRVRAPRKRRRAISKAVFNPNR